MLLESLTSPQRFITTRTAVCGQRALVRESAQRALMDDLIAEINKWGTSCLRGNMEMLHWPDLKKNCETVAQLMAFWAYLRSFGIICRTEKMNENAEISEGSWAVIHQRRSESLRRSRSGHGFQTCGEIRSAAQLMFLLTPHRTADCLLCAYKWKLRLLKALISRSSAMFV